MKNRLLKIIIFTLFTISFVFCNNIVLADTAKSQFISSLTKTGEGTGHLNVSGEATGIFKNKSLAEVIGSVIGIALSLVGVFFLVLIIYAGYTWMVARGNAPEVEKAKNTIINATIGLLVVLTAYAITIFISDMLTLKSPAI